MRPDAGPLFIARHCLVCGFKSRDSVCPRCNTILRSDRAACRRCGKAFNGWIATCDACGASTVPVQDGPRAREAMTALASIPGISAEHAKDLAARGPEDFLREECEHEIDAWRQKGFDVAPVEQLVAEDLSSFRAGGTRLIRWQAMKKAGSGA